MRRLRRVTFATSRNWVEGVAASGAFPNLVELTPEMLNILSDPAFVALPDIPQNFARAYRIAELRTIARATEADKVEQAKRAATSVTGASTASASADAQRASRSLRAELEAAFV